ncbi:MAG TPA: lysylphosphatidylglycerol synthase transmembrane domain-containing protein [Anaerolineae bacterium]|nr:lysylphosphatidylglycerol synthase transmembrane domain-containing protein [Anaerolineae bacterium]
MKPITTPTAKRQTRFGIMISIISLIALFFIASPRDIWSQLQTTHYSYLLLSTLGIITFMTIRAIRWRFILHNHWSWANIFHRQNIGFMLTYLLPLRIGDIARVTLVSQSPEVPLATGFSTVVVEQILDLLFIVLLLPLTVASLPFLPYEVQLAGQVSTGIALTAFIILILAANSPQLSLRWLTIILNHLSFLPQKFILEQTKNLLQGLDRLTRWRDALTLSTLTIAIWLPVIFAYYWGLRAVNIEPTWYMSSFVVCMAALSIAVPSSPGQIGVFHASVTFALVTVLGQPQNPAATFAVIYHALSLIIMVTLGLIGWYKLQINIPQLVTNAWQLIRRPTLAEE